jgi:hypothetical protein
VSNGVPFDPAAVKGGDTIHGVDPGSLIAGRPNLIQSRLDFQRQLLVQGIDRFTPIIVTVHGIVYDGNHAARAAIEAGKTVAVLVVDIPAKGFGSIWKLPVV